ncbi:MAG: hypothetical protein ABW167_06685 [Baekduia sp.]
MLKMVSKKSMLLLGVVMALCAFVLPSVASAASWTPVGTTDGRIDSGNIGFSLPALNTGSSCPTASFNVTIDSAAVATITGASFGPNCMGDLGGGVGCTTTAVGTFPVPWRATPIDTTRIEIHGVDIDVNFETTPGTLNECSTNGLNIRLTGTVTISFTPGPAGDRTLDFNGATGLAAHIPGIGNGIPTVARGTALGTGLLNVLM